MPQDSDQYRDKKAFFDSLLTIFGRKPVLEALQDSQLDFYKIHLADSNKPGGIINEITELAKRRQIEVVYHDRKALSRISRNSKQDQGVAADIQLNNYQTVEQFLAKRKEQADKPYRLIALDSITNPQNLGMIIRSACAGYIDGLIVPQKGCAAISPLVIKASAGTLFKAPLIFCNTLQEALKKLSSQHTEICTLSSHAKQSLFDYQPQGNSIFILGNETEGVSQAVLNQSDQQLKIPMNNGVESLNVAITAAIIAFQQ
jgi:23S rRNA (guanosine2251-2'-O)-methyltransferase